MAAIQSTTPKLDLRFDAVGLSQNANVFHITIGYERQSGEETTQGISGMRTPLLLDVPKTHMSRHERITAFKERNGIWTWYCKMRREDHPWEAMLEHRARKRLAGYLDHDDPDDPISLIAGYCRLLDEAGLLMTGETERDAIRRLCAHNRIPCTL